MSPPRDRASVVAWLREQGKELTRLPGRLARVAADRRVPLKAKVLLGFVALYLLNPIDLIPDFIPVIGALDDVLVVAGALALAARLVPAEVWQEHFGEQQGHPAR